MGAVVSVRNAEYLPHIATSALLLRCQQLENAVKNVQVGGFCQVFPAKSAMRSAKSARERPISALSATLKSRYGNMMRVSRVVLRSALPIRSRVPKMPLCARNATQSARPAKALDRTVPPARIWSPPTQICSSLKVSAWRNALVGRSRTMIRMSAKTQSIRSAHSRRCSCSLL